ncbi:C-type lectin domain family 19 member A-like [Mytilus trossulus]|uniref:C-type lectin domain family 19 member A-like n=1 Tax=Mytilus trossulus TaxID=6551 RepID=UPI003003B7B9
MVKQNKLFLFITWLLLSQSVCQAQVIPLRNVVDQQQSIFLIDDVEVGDDQELGIGSAALPGLASFPFPLIILVPLMTMMAMTMMESMSLTAVAQSVTNQTAVETVTTAAVACPTPEPLPATTPCVPSSCPEGYRLLDDQNVSPNCYMFSGTTRKKWCEALMKCTMTKGATLWVPNSEAEANAVRTTFSIPPATRIWTGGNDLKDNNGNFVFAIDNSEFSFDNLEFGTGDDGPKESNCVIIRYLENPLPWRWNDRNCDRDTLFVCELPRTPCP